MKIISLNCYLGNVFEPLMAFLTEEAPTTDVFCLQEMQSNPKEDITAAQKRGRANVLQEIIKRLPDFHCEFAPMQDDYEIDAVYPKQMQLGIATFYKKTLPVSEKGSFFIYNQFNSLQSNNYETLGHVALFIHVDGARPLTIVNVHGNCKPGSKRDTPKRLEQSQKVIDFLAPRTGEKIIAGDFNLHPDTESVRLFEKSGYRNLISEYNIQETRGTNFRKLFPEFGETPEGFQHFADYTFVTPGLKVTRFEVPDVPVSDHLPMILEIE